MNNGGLIKYFNLEEWFNNLSETEKEKVREYYFCDLGIGFTISTNQNNNLSINPGHPDRDESILEVGDPEKYLNSIHPRLTQEKFLQKIGSTAIHFKDYEFAEKAISKALEVQYIDPVTRHFNYNILIDLYYKLRNKKDDALDKCIQYCKEDIKYLDDFLNSYKKEEESLTSDSPSDFYQGVSFPRIPSIERLSIIYEKQGNIEDAIKICDIALKYELKDSTKGGFQKRKDRLEKKLTEPRLNVYQKPKTGKVQIKKKKNIRPIITYNSNIFQNNSEFDFHITNTHQTNMEYSKYWNELVDFLFEFINQAAGREIAFKEFRKNYPLPIVTTYQRVHKYNFCVELSERDIDLIGIKNNDNSKNLKETINLDIEVFTDANCDQFVDDLYDFLVNLNPCYEIKSIKVSQPWLLSVSVDKINRSHLELEFKINIIHDN